MAIIYPPPLSPIPVDLMPSVRAGWDFAPLSQPTPIGEHKWPEGTRPWTTVWCITYNHRDYLRDCVEGFLRQKTTFPVQILIHDDASTDGTVELIREYESQFPDLFVGILQPENLYSRGVPKNLIDITDGKYLAICEGDDYWLVEDKLQQQVDLLVRDTRSILVGTRAFLWAAGSKQPYAIEPSVEPIAIDSLSADELFIGGVWLHMATRVWQTDFLRRFYTDVPPGVGRLDLGQALYTIAAVIRGEGNVHLLDMVSSVYRKHSQGTYTGASAAANARTTLSIAEGAMRFFPAGRGRRLIERYVADCITTLLLTESRIGMRDRIKMMARTAWLARHAPVALARFLRLQLRTLGR